jgi:putative Holliday junction resolvase
VRVLGVDFGSKRIGIAVGETEHRIPSPRPAIASTKGLTGNAQALKTIVEKEMAAGIALGIPRNEEDGSMANVCKKLAEELRNQGITVIEVDESLTSVDAEERLRQLGWTAAQRDRYKDSEAACLILERYFEEHGQA